MQPPALDSYSLRLVVTRKLYDQGTLVQQASSLAGLAPGTVGGYQVNIIVPPSAPSGAARLTLYVDGIGSQTGVTIQVR